MSRRQQGVSAPLGDLLILLRDPRSSMTHRAVSEVLRLNVIGNEPLPALIQLIRRWLPIGVKHLG